MELTGSICNDFHIYKLVAVSMVMKLTRMKGKISMDTGLLSREAVGETGAIDIYFWCPCTTGHSMDVV